MIDAIDGDELIDWLRKQPLSLSPNDQTLITHAGVPCIWNARTNCGIGKEVQQVVGHDDLSILDAFLAEMYGDNLIYG